MEKTMMNTMFEMPSDETIKECIVTKEAVEGSMQPELIKEEPALLPEQQELYKSAGLHSLQPHTDVL